MELLHVLSRLLLCPGYHGLDPSSSSPAYLTKQTLYKTQKPPQQIISFLYLIFFPRSKTLSKNKTSAATTPTTTNYLQGKLTKPWTSARPWLGEIYFSSKTYIFGKT
jgi:hypothetical protein